MLFKCQLCSEKDSRISELSRQVAMLEKLVLPQKSTQDITLADREADVLLGSGPDLILPEDTISLEASRLLGGDYEYPEGY